MAAGSGPAGGGIIVVPMVTGQKTRLSAQHTALAGTVRVRAKCANLQNTITFGDDSNDEDDLHDGDSIVMAHPSGVDLFIWFGKGTTGDEIHVIHGGGF